LLRSPFFWAALFGIITIPAVRPFLRHVPDAPAVRGKIPAFSLTDQAGAPFGSEQLGGKVWVAGFFCTRCREPGDSMTRAMFKLQERFAQHGTPVMLVSFSVDPTRDTASRIQEYAAKHTVDPARWRLLTGSADAMKKVAVQGFDRFRSDRSSHASRRRLAIVDGQGGMRGFYGLDESGLDEIFHRSRHVLRDTKGLH